VPLLFGGLLVWKGQGIQGARHHLKKQVEGWLGFLYESYRTDMYWFEMIWIGRRLAVSVAGFVIPSENLLQNRFIMSILVISLTRQWIVWPFQTDLEKIMEGLALGVLIITFGSS